MPRKICFLLVPNLIENCSCNIKALHHSIGSLPECFWIYVGSVLKKVLPLQMIASRVKFYFQVLSLSLTSDVKETVCIHWIYFIGHLLHVISKFSSHILQRLIKSGTFSVKNFNFNLRDSRMFGTVCVCALVNICKQRQFWRKGNCEVCSLCVFCL